MLVELSVSAVNAVAGLAAELDLTAGLQRDLRLISAERDDVTVLFLGVPAEPLDQLPQNKSDPALAEIGNRLARVSIDADLFVFGTDAPLVARLAGVLKVSFQLVIFFNDRQGSECSAGMADESRPFP